MMKIVVLAFLAAAAAAPAQVEDVDEDIRRLALQNPDLFQGDILGIDPHDRNVIPETHLRWTEGKIPYVIDSSLSQHTALIQQAIDNYHTHTCLRFAPRTSESNYIRIYSGQGCYSSVGMIGGQQLLSISEGCFFVGTVIHLFGHAVGFYHEQNRSDRDNYLIIYWENIQNGMQSAFALFRPNENWLINDFDHGSIMIYGNKAFSKDGVSNTMVSKNGVKLHDPHEKYSLNPSDIDRVKKMYNC